MYDESRGRVLLWAARPASENTELFEWDTEAQTWTLVSPAGISPAPNVFGGTRVYDVQNQESVLFQNEDVWVISGVKDTAYQFDIHVPADIQSPGAQRR